MIAGSQAEPSRHKCLIYDGPPSEQLPVVLPLLEDALERNWRCLYLGDPDMVRMVDEALAAQGLDTRREISRGALILSSDRSHLAGGTFDPEIMIDGLCALIDGAVRDGFAGLCATGDMRWELGEDRNFDRLLEYEARLERVFRDKPLRGICQYHRDLVPPQAIQDALVTHRSAYIGAVLNRENLFYLPPEVLLDRSGSGRSKQAEWLSQQIIRILDAEHARDQALARLAELNRDLERRVAERTAELRVAMQQLESFSYSVSHDLRAPLRAIGGFSEILAEEFGAVLGTEGRKHLDRVRGGVRHMSELIEGLLALSRVMKVELHRRPVDLSALADEAVRELREAEHGRLVEVAIHPGLRTTGDRTLLRVALTNLLANAFKFTAPRPTARIEVGRRGEDEGGQPVFFVRDNGAGFDMQHVQRLFGVFQRLHREEEFPGTGVGLATVQRVIERHGGRIWAEAQVDHGATFFFTLPPLS